MSLINDALRRSGQSKKSPADPAGGSPMQPAVPPQGTAPSSFSPLFYLLIVGVVVLLAYWIFSGKKPQPVRVVSVTNATPAMPAPLIAEPVAPAVAPAEVIPAPAAVDPDETPAAPTALPDSSGVETNGVATAAEPPPPPPAPPALKLQGIFYRVKNPSALINGKSVMVGDTVAEARVTKITKDGVTVERDGQVIELKVP